MLHNQGLRVAQRSRGDVIDAGTDIYLADTLGELGIFYRLSNIVFVGGTMVDLGGHNPFEPARLNNALIAGPSEFKQNVAAVPMRQKASSPHQALQHE